MRHILTHLSLFSGIGGLDLAAEWAGFKTVGQVEFADFQNKVLEKHWPNVPRWKDVRELSADEFIRTTGIRKLDCLSGGFPCQPHSIAGKRKASCDERDLWPEMRRIISEIRPKWVVAENVRGLLSSESGRFFRAILRDFSDMGFDVGWCCYRAADIGAVHSRERVGIIAHDRTLRKLWGGDYKETSSDTHSKRFYGLFSGECGKEEKSSGQAKRCEDRQLLALYTGTTAVLHNGDSECVKPLLTRNDDGFSKTMDRNKSLGNAVVPQQFYPIFKAIAEIEMNTQRRE